MKRLEIAIVGDASSYERSLKRAAKDTTKFNREIGKMTRGVAAGSGVFKGLGRSLAFASGGFLAFASITDVLKNTITQATEAAKVQRQLAAQFKASGQSLGQYQQQIDETSNKLSVLAGIENDELKAAFVVAFRGTQDVSTALKIQAVAADVARGANKPLAASTIALTKAFLGQTTALRRLGINVPATLHGMEALNFVQKRFAGQAAAGTTAQDRFAAAIKNTEELIGTALLPTFNKLLDSVSKWLAQPQNQKKIQEDTKKTIGFFGKLAHVAGNVAGGFKSLVDPINEAGKASRRLNDQIEKFLVNFARIPRAAKTGEDIRLFGLGAIAPPATGEDVAQRNVAARTAAFGKDPTRRRRASLAFQASLLQEQLAKAELTAGQRDDRAALTRMRNLLKRQISATKDLHDRTALYQQLGSVEQQIAQIDAQGAADRKTAQQKELDARKKVAADARRHAERVKALQLQAAARLTTAQFRQLGFGPGGADLIPTGRQLLKRLGKIKDQVKGTILDTQENRKLLDRIRHTLLDGLGKLAPEVRQKVQELLDALDADAPAKKRGKRTKSPLEQFAGLGSVVSSGLTGQGLPVGVPLPAVWQRMLHDPSLLPGTARPAGMVIQHQTNHFHGVQDVGAMENELHKRAKQRPHTRRGP